MKHTPGPWRLEDESEGGFNVVSEFVEDHASHYCVIVTRGGWPNRAEMSRANARLIAAAPDLLDMCKRLRSEIQEDAPSHQNDYCYETLRLYDALIAKVEPK